MINILKRVVFVVACGLFIPFSVITFSGWLTISMTTSIIGYAIIPIEYTITGDTELCEKMMDFFWIYLPKFYDEQTELFFKFIHPKNNYDEVKFK